MPDCPEITHSLFVICELCMIMTCQETQKSECTSSNDQPISTFLKFADLGKFETIFESFGVHKFEHLSDVQVEDLYKFGKQYETN